jgi:hypothetical protein
MTVLLHRDFPSLADRPVADRLGRCSPSADLHEVCAAFDYSLVRSYQGIGDTIV